MRGIKFRAWDINNYKMYYGSMCSSGRLIWGKDHINPPSGQEYIIEQYTGIKDKNDIEIYEGDIVQFKGKNESPKTIEYFNCGYPVLCDAVKYNRTVEIIGNIHE